MNDLVSRGSKTAKDGFCNEDFVIEVFNNWKDNILGQNWIEKMGYSLREIEYVKAEKIKGSFKADIQVQVSIKLKSLIDAQNLQIKLASNLVGFNQVDKRWVSSYAEMWNMPEKIVQILKYFTGEIPPYILNPADNRRMFMNEFEEEDQNLLIKFIKENQALIVCDILKGRGQFSAEWMLVILKNGDLRWCLEPMNFCLNFFGNGEVEITKQGSIKIGKITIQRKGGDGGRKTAQMLQFKINPCLLFDLN
jgi:hypothetical protein